MAKVWKRKKKNVLVVDMICNRKHASRKDCKALEVVSSESH